MTHSNFLSFFKEQLAEDTEITGETKFKELQGWDSLTLVLVMTGIKENYEKEVKAEDVNECETVDDLYNLINS